MKRLLILLLFPLMFVANSCQNRQPATKGPIKEYQSRLRVGSQLLHIDVADTPASREQGLSNRARMNEDQGMLFEFKNTGESRPGFWMKDMRFGLDFVWIHKGKIIAITPNIPAPQPQEKLRTYFPPSEIDEVLEVNGGWSQRHEIKVGDLISPSIQSTAQ